MSRPSGALRGVAVLVALQGVGLLVAAGFYAVELLVATVSDAGRAAVTAVLALLAAAELILVARGLARGRRWARSPALVTNVILLPVAFGLLQGGVWYVGGPLLLWALAVVGLLL
ncbi:MAG TPA: hypothetical protein VLW53_11420, partial [Candidatus Eisenbacteria bacterium]|nr:hypothetical protein [Candidatus Eisenbacteria bacterium]